MGDTWMERKLRLEAQYGDIHTRHGWQVPADLFLLPEEWLTQHAGCVGRWYQYGIAAGTVSIRLEALPFA